MYCTEEITCDTVGTFRRPGNCAPLFTPLAFFAEKKSPNFSPIFFPNSRATAAYNSKTSAAGASLWRGLFSQRFNVLPTTQVPRGGAEDESEPLTPQLSPANASSDDDNRPRRGQVARERILAGDVATTGSGDSPS